jgi:hypothetical protein
MHYEVMRGKRARWTNTGVEQQLPPTGRRRTVDVMKLRSQFHEAPPYGHFADHDRL